MTAPRVFVPDAARERGAVLTDMLLEHHVPRVAEQRRRWFAERPRGAVDGMTKELLRLRVASFTQCAYCNTIRLPAAGERPVSEDLVETMRSGAVSDLSADQQAALEVAESFLGARVDGGGRSGLPAAELHEMLVDLVGSLAFGKFRVMLGLSAAPDVPLG